MLINQVKKSVMNIHHLLNISMLLMIFFNSFLWAGMVDTSLTFENEMDVKRTLLEEDWNKTFQLLEYVNEKTDSPVARIIKGHACLALNHNNESINYFFSISSEYQIKQWLEWSGKLCKNNPNSPITYYLKGDALARNVNMDIAIECFNKSIEINDEYFLAYNARGVVYAIKGKVKLARIDFSKAIRLSNSNFADAFSNVGFLLIQQNIAIDGALRNFSKAINISNDFALAHHGKGCIELLLKNEKATQTLLKASNEATVCIKLKEIMDINQMRYAVHVIRTDPEFAMSETNSAGTTFNKSYDMLSDKAKDHLSKAQKYRENPSFINNQFAKFHGNRAVETLEKINDIHGMDQVNKFIYDNNNIAEIANFEINRVGSYNYDAQKFEKFIGDTAKVADAVGGVVSALDPSKVTGPIISATAKVVNVGSDRTYEWSNKHTSFWREYNISNNRNMSVPSYEIRAYDYREPQLPDFSKYESSPDYYDSSQQKSAGGANLNFDNINWVNEGEWPFEAYYALIYKIP